MKNGVQEDPKEHEHHVRQWLGGIWIVLTMIILFSAAMVPLLDWPITVTVFFVGIWIVVSTRAIFAFRRHRSGRWSR